MLQRVRRICDDSKDASVSNSGYQEACHEITIAKASLVFKDGVRPFTGPAVSVNWVRELPNVAYTLCLVSLCPVSLCPVCPVFGVCRHGSNLTGCRPDWEVRLCGK